MTYRFRPNSGQARQDRFAENDGELAEVKAICKGKRERLRSEETSQLRRILGERLRDESVAEFPIPYPIMESEWARHHGVGMGPAS